MGAPTKRHRCCLHYLFIAVVLLLSNGMLLQPPPGVTEDVIAFDRAVWTLVVEVVTMPWDTQVIILAVIADVVARCLCFLCNELFFTCRLPASQPSQDDEAKKDQLKVWHELAFTGAWVCATGAIVAPFLTVLTCAVSPQPRASAVARVFIVSLWLSHWVYPLCSAAFTTMVLAMASRSGTFDGLLSACPGIMDFLSVGVQTPEFLAWRVQRICTELITMRRVYHQETGGM